MVGSNDSFDVESTDEAIAVSNCTCKVGKRGRTHDNRMISLILSRTKTSSMLHY